MFEVLYTGGNVVEKMLSGLCQTDAAVAPLEQENPKILLELDDAHTDGGLTYAQSGGGMAKEMMNVLRPSTCRTPFSSNVTFAP